MSKDIVKKAVLALKKGEIICYPTDTLYGIGADIKNIESVEKVFHIKKRPMNIPLSVAVSSKKSLEKIAFLNGTADTLIDRFLPGPLCIILKKREIVPDLVTSGLKKVAVRIPDNKTALSILSLFGPVTCTSANIHKNPTPKVISDIRMQFKDDISIYIDEGKLSSKPSTIVDLTGKELKIIREGIISKDEIFDVI